jgi:hypothetical protein
MPLDSATYTPTAPRTAAREAAALAWHHAAGAKRTATADAGRATKEAIACGVLFDHAKHPREPGFEGVVYSGADVRISLKVGEPGSKLDLDTFLAALLLAGMKPAPLQRLVARHTHDTAPPHSFTSSVL